MAASVNTLLGKKFLHDSLVGWVSVLLNNPTVAAWQERKPQTTNLLNNEQNCF